jgi:hypothetical protein
MANYDRIQLLIVEVDREDVSDYRMLVDGKSFKYIIIDPGVYNPNQMTFDQEIIPQLPPMPEGDWNQGHITNTLRMATVVSLSMQGLYFRRSAVYGIQGKSTGLNWSRRSGLDPMSILRTSRRVLEQQVWQMRL